MADDSETNEVLIFCRYYYNDRVCPKGDTCRYPHKPKREIDPVAFPNEPGYLYGRVRQIQKTCRYFRRGNCRQQELCSYRHDNDNSLRSIQDQNRNFRNRDHRLQGHTTRSMPSTSSQPNHLSSTADLLNYLKLGDDTNQENASKELTKEDTKDAVAEPEAVEEEGACASPQFSLDEKMEKWVNAPEFVPKSCQRPRSYAEALGTEGQDDSNVRRLCPYANKDGVCRNLINCTYIHGELCDMCERFVLHPYDEDDRKRHRQDCLKQHEKNMELSFAIQRSKEKSCGVCFEVIMEKSTGEQRFGILPNCNHCFCLGCIRKWRQARQFENKIIRACPECRVTSDFVCPSMYWVDTKEDKEKLIDDYKNALSRKDCKYFKKGEGKCPFGNKCFYLHAFPDGRKCDVGPPPRQRRQRHVETDIDVLQVMLWDFLDERDFPWPSLADDLEDLVSFFTDSDESDWSDYELFLD